MVPFGEAQSEMYKASSRAFASLAHHMQDEVEFVNDYVVKYNTYGVKEVPCLR